MARMPSPWYRKSRNCWFVMLDGKLHNLGPNKKEAFEKFYRLIVSETRFVQVRNDFTQKPT